jgi:3-oxoacyl-[acyl-carrier protein] reductase
MRFSEKVAVITGGGNGIGRATALLMAREGAKVAIVDIEPTRLQLVSDAIRSEGGEVIAVEIDVLNEQAVACMAERILDRFQRIDILVNLVGGSTIVANPNVPADQLTSDEWERTMIFNLRGVFLCTRAVVGQMKRQGYGRIVNMSSIVSRGDMQTSNVAYATAKAGIRALTRKLAIELGPFGITCNATAPGTTLTDRIRELYSKRSPADLKAKLNNIPVGRMATPEDQAKVIAFLASDDAAFVSGQTIEVTGGE